MSDVSKSRQPIQMRLIERRRSRLVEIPVAKDNQPKTGSGIPVVQEISAEVVKAGKNSYVFGCFQGFMGGFGCWFLDNRDFIDPEGLILLDNRGWGTKRQKNGMMCVA